MQVRQGNDAARTGRYRGCMLLLRSGILSGIIRPIMLLISGIFLHKQHEFLRRRNDCPMAGVANARFCRSLILLSVRMSANFRSGCEISF